VYLVSDQPNLTFVLLKLAFDFVQRQYSQNIVYSEVRYSPHLLAESCFDHASDNSNGQARMAKTTPEEVQAAVTEGLRRGCHKFGIVVNQILCAIAWRPEWAWSVLELAKSHQNNFPCATVGIDIAAGEEHFDSQTHSDLHQPHYDMIQQAKRDGIPITLHAGEAGQHALQNIRRAIRKYGARRIGHGYRMAECIETMKEVREAGVHVEVCPTSSNETGGWVYSNDEKKDWTQHPAVSFLENGLSLSLSSDDPAIFHTSLAWQYRTALVKMKLSKEEIWRTNLHAVDGSFAPDGDKKLIREQIERFGLSHGFIRDHSLLEPSQGDRHAIREIQRSMRKSVSEGFLDRVYVGDDDEDHYV
jgi:adenosine deaminase